MEDNENDMVSEIYETSSTLTDASYIQNFIEELKIPSLKINPSQLNPNILKSFSHSLLSEILNNKYELQPSSTSLNITPNFMEYKTWLLKLIPHFLNNTPSYQCELKHIKHDPNSIYIQFHFELFAKHDIIPSLLRVGISLMFKIEMSLRSGNLSVHSIKARLLYRHRNGQSKSILKVHNKFKASESECKWMFYNNNLGKDGRCMCICKRDNCHYCMNKSNEDPFEEMRMYLCEIYGECIVDEKCFSEIWAFKNKKNSINNYCNYRCSFCIDQKGKLMKIFFHKEYDNDHNCYFFMCDICREYYLNTELEDELCPNCGKFYVNFSKINFMKFRIYN